MATSSLPALETPGFITRAIALLSIAGALVLLVYHAVQDFLQRHWIDTNGDVATIVTVALALALQFSSTSVAGWCGLLFVVVLAAVTLPTNQVHQWAHMRRPPAIIGWLQAHGVLLSHPEHALHHAPPYLTNYCIALGWANGVLVRINAFPRLERLITRVTGVQPRADDSSHALR